MIFARQHPDYSPSLYRYRSTEFRGLTDEPVEILFPLSIKKHPNPPFISSSIIVFWQNIRMVPGSSNLLCLKCSNASLANSVNITSIFSTYSGDTLKSRNFLNSNPALCLSPALRSDKNSLNGHSASKYHSGLLGIILWLAFSVCIFQSFEPYDDRKCHSTIRLNRITNFIWCHSESVL